MKRILIFAITLILSIHVYSQVSDTLSLSARLDQLEVENSMLKAKVEAYNDSNSNILNTVSITIAILLGIFGLVNITQLVQNHRLNNKKFSEIEQSVIERMNKVVGDQVSTRVSGKFSELEQLKHKILELEVLTWQNKCPSTDPQNINIEAMNLVRLLELSLNHYNYSAYEYHISNALEGIVTHLGEHSVSEHEKEKIYHAMKDLPSEFEFKKDKILKLLEKQ